MRRKVVFIILALLLLFPLKIEAVKVKSAQFGDSATVKVGETFNVPVDIDFTDVSNHDSNSFGIGGITLNLNFDDEVFSLVKVKAIGFKSMYDEKEKIVKSVIDDELIDNNCIDNVLWCGTYGVTLTFYVKNAEKAASSIKINDIVVMGYQLKEGAVESYDEANLLLFSTSTTRGQTFNITSGSVKKDAPKVENEITIEKMESTIVSIAKTKKEAILNSSNKVTHIDKDDNNYLKELSVKGYGLDFYKKTYDYELVLDKKVNRLEVEAKLDSDKATLEIIGADKLDKNNNKVLIKVKAEDGSVRVYTIKVIYEQNGNKKKTIKTIFTDIKDIFKEYKRLFIIGGIVIFVGIITAVVIGKINDKKLDDQVDKF